LIVEFSRHSKVIDAWREYSRVLGDKNNAELNKYRTHILHEMAKVLGYKIDKLDILEGKYIPMEWAMEYAEKRQMRSNIIEVTSGKSPLHVQLQEPSQTRSSCPPPSSQVNVLDRLLGSSSGGEQPD